MSRSWRSQPPASAWTRIIGVIASVLALISASHATPSVPGQISYQGYLREGRGDPVSGEINFQFYIYSDSTGGTVCWGPESHVGVPVVDGLFELILGEHVPIPSSCFDGSVKWLETWVGGAPLSPRKPLTSGPYAFGAPSPPGFQPFVSRNFETNYYAETDGFVTGYTTQLPTNYTYSVYEDGSNPPSTRIQYGYTVWVSGGYLSYAISFPVKKGYYWRVANSSGQGGTLCFFPMGQ
jgi:hypothetical protein